MSGGGDATATGLHVQGDFAPGTELGGRFRIESILGLGGMGVVYRATDLALGVPVALKLLRPELAHRQDVIDRFRQELLLARQVSSPHVVRIHDLAQHDGRWLISMDYVDGEPLDRRLDREGRLGIEDALRIARQVAEGLAAAHARGVVHRDLKPANVLLDAAGNAYVSDFGVARSLASSGLSEAGLTRQGTIVGTPDYLSPEQARGDPVDARSDLYALGLILHEMLAGKLPFAGGTLAETLAQRMLRAPAPVTQERPDTPPWLARLVDRLLRPQPAHRLQRAQDVVAAIDCREVARDLRPTRGGWIALAAVLAIALGAVGWWQWNARQPAAVVASPPLDRLLVLPLAGSGDPARDAALSARLRDALAAVPGFAVVDGERTTQALRQVDPTGNATPATAVLLREAAAAHLLRPALVREGNAWRVRAVLSTARRKPLSVDGPPAPDAPGAVQAWARAPATARALGLRAAVPALRMPASDAALVAFGGAQRKRAAGALEAALQDATRATAADPADAPAWLLQSQVAADVGAQDVAMDAAVRGSNAGATASPWLRRRLAAQRQLLEGDPAAAAGEWRALLAATPDDTDAELNRARALGAAGDMDAALAALQALTRRDPGDPRAWFERGKLSIMQGKAQVAVDDYLTRALVAFKRSRNLYGQAETVNALGVGYGRLGQTTDAIEQYRKAIELRRTLGNRRGVATSLRNLANALSLTGDFAGADAALQQARALNVALGDRDGHAAVDNELGLLAEERGDFPAALQRFQSALQTWQQTGDAHGAAQALNNIGFSHYQLGNYGDAQVYWQQASDAYGKLGDQTGRVRTMQNLGLLAVARGRWNDARALLSQSLVLSQRLQMLEEAAVSRRNLAELELSQGHLQAAIDQAAAAGASFRQRQDQRGIVEATLLRADALLAARAPAAAARALGAEAAALAAASSEQQALALLLRARIAAADGDAAGAARRLGEAGAAAKRSGVRHLQLRIALEGALARPAALQALDAPTAALGHASLRLSWLQQRMQQALAAGDVPAAIAAYAEATGLLRTGDALQAQALHALGARARARSGDATGAQSARLRRDQAQAALRGTVPAALRAGFDRALAADGAAP